MLLFPPYLYAASAIITEALAKSEDICRASSKSIPWLYINGICPVEMFSHSKLSHGSTGRLLSAEADNAVLTNVRITASANTKEIQNLSFISCDSSTTIFYHPSANSNICLFYHARIRPTTICIAAICTEFRARFW